MLHHFTSVADIDDWPTWLATAQSVKADPRAQHRLGSGKAMCLLFLNPSLRTRLSTQRAALNLGLDTVVFDVQQGGWQLEMTDGTVMNGDRAEHVREAAAVVGQYYDLIGVRAFASLKDRDEDYQEQVIQQFVRYAGCPVISLESSVRHPLQSLTDLITIEEHKPVDRPKVVISWAPHPRALPQAVANSLLEWTRLTDYEVVLTHPEGYALAEQFTQGITVTHDQDAALHGADFVYAKNWSSYENYGQILRTDDAWMITEEKMQHTNQAYFMHCLPVRRNVVVADAVLDSNRSLVIAQAANRVVAAQTVLQKLLERDAH
ncbi:MAG: N-acetylornithine carbamoyltransferase [Tunicatimonas sp.]